MKNQNQNQNQMTSNSMRRDQFVAEVGAGIFHRHPSVVADDEKINRLAREVAGIAAARETIATSPDHVAKIWRETFKHLAKAN